MGSGIGLFSKILQDKGATPVSVVNSRKCYEYQVEHYDFKILHKSYLDTGLPDNSVDTIVFLESFCYEKPQDIMLEVNRLLKPNGQLLIKDVSPTDKQRKFIEKADVTWKTKFATISEIQHTISEYLTILDFHFLNCDTSQADYFIRTNFKDYHKDSPTSKFSWYLLRGYKEEVK